MTDVAAADLSLEHKEAELAPSEHKHSEDMGKKTPIAPKEEVPEVDQKHENSTPQPAPEAQLEKDTTIRPRSPPEMETVPTPASSPVDEVQPNTKAEAINLLDESAVSTEKPCEDKEEKKKPLEAKKSVVKEASSTEFSSFSPLVESAFNTKEEMPKLRKAVSISKPAAEKTEQQEGDNKPSNPWGVQLKHDSRPNEPKATEVKKEKEPEQDTSPKKANPWGVQLKRTGSGIGAASSSSGGAASSRIAALAASFGGTNDNVTRKNNSPTKPSSTNTTTAPTTTNEKIAKFGGSNSSSSTNNNKGTTAPAGGHIAKLTAAFNSNSVSNATNNTKPTLGRRNSLEMHLQKEREEQEKVRKGNFGLQLRKASVPAPTTPVEPAAENVAAKPQEEGSNIFGVKLKKVTAQPQQDDLPVDTPTPPVDAQQQVAPSSSAEPVTSVDEPVEVPAAAETEVQA